MYRGIGNYLPTTPCNGLTGLGCADCGCGSKNLAGLGLFDTGLDWTGWGMGEWASIAFVGYVLVSMLNDTRAGIGEVRKRASKYEIRKRGKRRRN